MKQLLTLSMLGVLASVGLSSALAIEPPDGRLPPASDSFAPPPLAGPTRQSVTPAPQPHISGSAPALHLAQPGTIEAAAQRPVSSDGVRSSVTFKPGPSFDGVVRTAAMQPDLLPQGVAPGASESIAPGAPDVARSANCSLIELEEMALANNPTLGQAAARVQAARGTYIQAGLRPNPTIGYEGSEIGNEGKSGQQGVVLGQEFVLGHKRELSQNAAAQAVNQANQEFAAQRMRVVNDVRTGFYDTLVAQRRLEIVQQLTGLGEQGLKTTERLLDAQEVTRADLLQARIELNSVRILAANANNTYLSAWRRLAATLGMPEMPPPHLSGDLESGIRDLSWEQSLQQLSANSPELAAARAGVGQAQWALRRARAEPIPNVDMQLTMQHDNATSDDIVGVQAAIPLPIFNRNQGAITRAQAELNVASGEVQRVQLDLQQRLAQAFERYSNAMQQVDRYAKEILPDAKESLDLVTAGYRQGEYSFLVLLTAQRTYFRTNLIYLESLRELQENSVLIEGLLLNGSLSRDSSSVGGAGRMSGDSGSIMSGLER